MSKPEFTFSINQEANHTRPESYGSNEFNANHRKEKNFYKSIKIIKFNTLTNEFSEVLDLRLYRTDARNYACIWLDCYSVSSYAGGYGYHRESQAVWSVLSKLGLETSVLGGLGGSGDHWYKEALLFIVKSLENNANSSSLYHMVESYA